MKCINSDTQWEQSLIMKDYPVFNFRFIESLRVDYFSSYLITVSYLNYQLFYVKIMLFIL